MFTVRLNRSKSPSIYLMSENYIKIYARALVFYLDILPIYNPTPFQWINSHLLTVIIAFLPIKSSMLN